MSGIAGIIHFDGAPVEPGLIEKMTSATSHRGPDGIQHWVKGNVALGQCMLRTTPESLEETQPLTNEDGSIVLVMDGRVDNWEELRKELLRRGAVLRNRSDAELVLRSYEIWARDCPLHIDGDFALVIWDGRRRALFCARDRMGKRPFYYSLAHDTLAFASEFRALLTLRTVSTHINSQSVVDHLLTGGSSLTDTLVVGVSRLPPATAMQRRGEDLEQWRYWDIDCGRELRYPKAQDYEDHFRHAFGEAVRKCLRSVTPVGVLLSGGLDSSAVLAVASKLLEPAEAPTALSATFPGRPCDETTYIEGAIRATGAKGVQVPYTPFRGQFYVDQILHHKDVCDSPNATHLRPLLEVARNEGVRVILTGHGADEWFGRNQEYVAALLQTGDLRHLASACLHDARSEGDPSGVLKALVKDIIRPFAPASLVQGVRLMRQMMLGRDRTPSPLVPPAAGQRITSAERLRVSGRCSRMGRRSHSYMHALMPLGEAVRGTEMDERTASSYLIEQRDPFQDKQLVEFAFAVPEPLRSGAEGKRLLRSSLQRVLPEEIRLRSTKAEFSSTLADALLDPLVAKHLSCQRLGSRGWINRAGVAEKYARFESLYRRGDSQYIYDTWDLWMAFVMETWVAVMED